MKTVLVLGGGVGGVVTANALRRTLDRADRVVVVDRQPDQLFAPSLLWLMVGRRQPARLARPIAELLNPGIEFVRATVREIDPDQRRVVTEAGELGGDAIVVALGAQLAPEASPGYAETAHDFFTVPGASSFRDALGRFGGGRVAVTVTSLPFKCPAAPYEAAFLIDAALRERGIRERTEIDVYTPEPAPMPVAGPALGRAVVALLEQRGIRYHPDRPVQGYDPERHRILFADGTSAKVDLLAATPPHRAPDAVRESGLANAAGWIPVDRETLETGREDVFAIGDVTAVQLVNGKLLPKAGVFAHGEALVVAERIAARFGRGREARFDGLGYCWVELGAGRAAFAVGQFFAQPDPRLTLRRPRRIWHLGKVLFERYWLGSRLERRLAGLGLQLGARALGLSSRL